MFSESKTGAGFFVSITTISVVILLILSKAFWELLEYISDNSVNVLPWVSGNMSMAKMHNKIQIALWTQNTAGNPIIWTSEGNIFKLMKDTKYLETITI